jgi:hypothetical protein
VKKEEQRRREKQHAGVRMNEVADSFDDQVANL